MNPIRKVLFGGSFNPFTAGHADIVARALNLFDKVVICIGNNADKHSPSREVFGDAEARCRDIARFYIDCPQVEVRVTSGLMVLAAKECGAQALLRAVRSVKDYEYERDMADTNRRLTGIDTVFLFADSALGSLSSSVVRELFSYGCDISSFLPQNFIVSSLTNSHID